VALSPLPARPDGDHPAVRGDDRPPQHRDQCAGYHRAAGGDHDGHHAAGGDDDNGGAATDLVDVGALDNGRADDAPPDHVAVDDPAADRDALARCGQKAPAPGVPGCG